MKTIAALYVQEDGCYIGLNHVEPWGVSKDARLYRGPHSVVAHPPCQLWVNFAALNYRRWGGEHNRPGNDGGCFKAALRDVRLWGGVLEHPAFSKAFAAHKIPAPVGIGWNQIGKHEFVCEVWQSAYGHKARKRTWLFVNSISKPEELNWRREAGVCQVGWFDRNKPTLSKKEASATPSAFREALISLARHSR